MAADPSVSPADTIRRALEKQPKSSRYRVDERTSEIIPGSMERVHADPDIRDALAVLDVLLAVGERDKAEIERLTDERDAAVREAGVWQRDRNVQVAALTSERERDGRQIARLTETLVKAALPLEVLRGQIAVKPYQELTPDLQAQIIEATDAIRSVVAVLAGDEDANGD